MENRRKRSSSGEIFSFPSTPNQDSDFEFGCFTPDLPSYRTSPADHLFFNGRLLPHAFPLRPAAAATSSMVAADVSRGTSRTSSINSKDSLIMCSRSNSSNSRSSCSSARTSSSEHSERRLLYHSRSSKTVSSSAAQLYRDSQRWQYNITAVPVLKREVSRRKTAGGVGVKGDLKKQSSNYHDQQKIGSSSSNSRSRRGKSAGPCLRLFRLLLLVCRECHAMEPSRKQHVVQANLTTTVTVR